MEVVNSKPVMIFRNDYKGNTYYSIGVSKKDVNNNYVNGYISCRFKKGIELKSRTTIQIKSAWIDFYLKDKKTIDYIFINDFDIVAEPNPEHKEVQNMMEDPHYKTESDTFSQIEITDNDLPF